MSERRIPLSEPRMSGNEARYLAECVETNWVSSAGPFVERFEREVARATGVPHAVACVNGTAALHVALLVAGVEPDDEVLVSDLTFIASANAIRYCRAWPVLIDAEARYWQIDPDKVRDFLARECRWRKRRLVNRRTGRRIRAIMPAHILGHPADMAPILEAARRFELPVVADAAEALGALYRGEPVARIADVAALSFNGNKIVTAGGGGAVLTGTAQLAERARYLTNQAKDDPVESLHGEVGFNYRLTNLQSAVGLAQLERLDRCLESKRATAAYYARALGGLPLELPEEAVWARSSWWLYTVLIEEEKFGVDRASVMRALAARGIETRPLWMPVSGQRPFADCQAYRSEHALGLHRRSLSLPCSVGIAEDDLTRVASALAETHAEFAGAGGSARVRRGSR
ncbi:MAG: LegC family aminotransferase [Candidatus Rokubacteria bacterium]|nr:LegC family aminotransferase [Candidatus Rokubacteria bacterium]